MFKKVSGLIFMSVFALSAMSSLQAEYDNNSCYDPCDSCSNRFWVEADYLYWKINDSPEPVPLVIQQPVSGGPSTTILGGSKINTDWRSGGKFGLGYWFDDCLTWGGEVNYFFLGEKSRNFEVASDANGAPRLRIPYFNVQTGLEDSSPLATPGLYRGSAALKLKNSMQGAELNLVKTIPVCDCHTKFGLLAGFRYWNFDEHLQFIGNSPVITPVTIYNYYDKFHVENNFYGGQIGASFDYNYCSFFLNVKGKVAFGALCQETVIDGFFETSEFTGLVETFNSGFFAEPTNIGKHKKTRFSVLPELNVNIGYDVTDNFRLQVGYSVLYVSDVLFAGKQIDRNINPSQSANIDFTDTPVLVGEPSPNAKMRTDSLWAQGLNVGFEFKF